MALANPRNDAAFYIAGCLLCWAGSCMALVNPRNDAAFYIAGCLLCWAGSCMALANPRNDAAFHVAGLSCDPVFIIYMCMVYSTKLLHVCCHVS